MKIFFCFELMDNVLTKAWLRAMPKVVVDLKSIFGKK